MELPGLSKQTHCIIKEIKNTLNPITLIVSGTQKHITKPVYLLRFHRRPVSDQVLLR